MRISRLISTIIIFRVNFRSPFLLLYFFVFLFLLSYISNLFYRDRTPQFGFIDSKLVILIGDVAGHLIICFKMIQSLSRSSHIFVDIIPEGRKPLLDLNCAVLSNSLPTLEL